MAEILLNNLPKGAKVLADKAYDAEWIRDVIEDQDCQAHIPPRDDYRYEVHYSKRLYRKRNLIERFFNKIKHFRRIATRYDKHAANYIAMVRLAAARLWLRFYESTT